MAKRKRKSLDKTVADTEEVDRPDDFAEEDDKEESGKENDGEMGEEGEGEELASASKKAPKILPKRAAPEIYDAMNTVLEKTFKDLAEAKLKVKIVTFDAGKDKDDMPVPALKVRGTAVQYETKLNNVLNRVVGGPDVIIKLDLGVWESFTPVQRKSLLDRALRHVAITMEDGKLKRDDAGRPVTKYRQPDWQVSGFNENVKLYGDDSVDVIDWTKFQNKHGQGMMPFMAQG